MTLLRKEMFEMPEGVLYLDGNSLGPLPKGVAARVADVMKSAFNGRRIVIFSGGAKKGADSVYDDARAIRDGGGNGSIIGRNTFQRERGDAIDMLNKLIDIYKGKA